MVHGGDKMSYFSIDIDQKAKQIQWQNKNRKIVVLHRNYLEAALEKELLMVENLDWI